MALASHPWVRHRSRFALPSVWHRQQTVSPAGIRITSCAEVLAPDEAVEYARRRRDLGSGRCPSCAAHQEAMRRA